MKTILITGGTGLIGKHLCKKLQALGYHVIILSRIGNANQNPPIYAWNVNKKELNKEAIEKADCIIHLAGANIGDKRWTPKRKQEILDSRIKASQLLFEKTKETPNQLKVFISASAIGYYGAITSGTIFKETDAPANDFLGDVCHQWEQSVDAFETLGIRVVKIRTGVILTKQGGALAKMSRIIKMGLGSAIGNGKQYIPWIHVDDLCEICIKAIEDTQMKGAYNAVAPEHKTNKEFNRTIAHVMHKAFWFPNVPAFALKLLFGSMSVILLKGSRVSSEKIITAGHSFRFATLESALADLFSPSSPK